MEVRLERVKACFVPQWCAWHDPFWFFSIELGQPEGSRHFLTFVRLRSLRESPVFLWQGIQNHHQGRDAASFLIEGICDDAGWHFVAVKGAAHRDSQQSRKLAPDHSEQFEARDSRHIKIG